jgi:hypothetical protein
MTKVTAGFTGTWRAWFGEVLPISAVVSPDVREIIYPG